MPADATIVPLRCRFRHGTGRQDAGRKARRRARSSRSDALPQQPPVRELPPPTRARTREPPAERASDPAATAKSGRRRWLRWSAVCAAAARPDRRRLLVRHRRPGDVDRQRLCRGRQGRHLDRRLRHRQGDRRHRATSTSKPARSCTASTISPFQLALDTRQGASSADRAQRPSNALKANYRRMLQAQLKQAQVDVEYYERELRPLSRTSSTKTSLRKANFRHSARFTLQNAQAEARLAQPAARRDRRQPQRRSRYRGRAAPALSRRPWRSATRRAPARSHRREGAVRRHRDERARDRTRQVPRRPR